MSIYALDEAKNAECAREMWELNDYVVPTFNYELRHDKPPLHYYAMMLAYETFGVSEFSARLFSAVFGALTVVVMFFFTQSYLGNWTAGLSAFALLASLHFSIQFHMAVPDPYLIFWLTLSFLSLYHGFQQQKVGFVLLSYVAMGLGALTKGPIALALPAMAWGVYLIFTRQFTWKHVVRTQPWTGVVIVLLVAGPWYYLVHQQTNGAWTEAFFFQHNIGRYTSTMEGHGGIPFLPVVYILAGMLPFSIFLIQAVRTSWLERKESDFLFFSLCVAATLILFFSFSSTQLPNYTVPSYPFLAILLGYYLCKGMSYRSNTWSLWVYLGLMFLIPIAAYIGLAYDPAMAPYRLRVALGLFLLPIGAFLALMSYYRHATHATVLTLGFSWLLTAGVFYYVIMPPIDQHNPVVNNLDLFSSDTPVAQYKIMNRAFVFYLEREVPKLKEASAVQTYFEEHPDGLLITREKYWKELKEIKGLERMVSEKDLLEKYTTLILRKKSSH